MSPSLVRPRAPSAPGPGPMPGGLLKSLELEVARRIDGLLVGEFRSTMLGQGTELAQIREYVPGDDVREIEWNVTARMGEPHVRVQVAERVLTTWIVLDTSASMSFGTADRRKIDVAEGVALALGHLGTRRANRVGMVSFGAHGLRIVPPKDGRLGMLRLLMELRRDTPTEGTGTYSLGEALRRSAGIFRTRSAVFVVSDLIGPKDWRKQLVRLAGRHQVAIVEIGDPRERDIPDIGQTWMVDPESGRQMRLDTRDRAFRERFRQAVAADRAEVADMIRSTGASHVTLSTSGDWLRTLAGFLSVKGPHR